MIMDSAQEEGDSLRVLSLQSWINGKVDCEKEEKFPEERGVFCKNQDGNAQAGLDPTKDWESGSTDDTLSFVVLSRSSLDSIKASSMASYVDIQQKAMSIDYNSMISSLNSNEIHQKLTELLQENGKLKETLKQNNLAMKQQFSTLATWHEEIMKVHKNHKEKFAETRELINYLKKQNAELKQKLDNECVGNTTVINPADMRNETEEVEATLSPSDFREKVPSLSKELSSFRAGFGEILSDLKDARSFGLYDLLTSQTIKADDRSSNVSTKESKGSHECVASQSLPNSSKQLVNKRCDKCNAKDESIKNLSEFVSLLEYKLKHAAALIQFCIQNSAPSERHVHSIQRFNKELSEIFAAEIKQFPALPHYLNNFIAETLTDATASKPDDRDACKVDDKSCFRRCEGSVQENSTDTRSYEATKPERQAQETLSDYEASLFNLEATADKAPKLSGTANIDVDLLQRLIKSASMEDRGSCEAERKSLERQRANVEQERKMLEAQRKSLEAEYKSLNDTRQLLQQERISLNEEKTSLDRQSQLYEDHEKSFQKERKAFEVKYDQLATEKKALQDDLDRKDMWLKVLHEEVEQHKEDKQVLETQLKIYEEDFEQERKIKCTLLSEKDKLSMDLQNQFEYNKKLQSEIARLKGQCSSETSGQSADSNNPSLTPPEMSNLSCPMCGTRFRDVQSLESHVLLCLELA